MKEDIIGGFSLPFAQDTPTGRKSHKGSYSLEDIHSVNAVEHSSPYESLYPLGNQEGLNSFRGEIAIKVLR